mmetsp:Transcript_32371/g.85050  ORF Transcript_32371/g.85050 Transcript_32371/m.85050 type:complete len:368 (+) Transcript_32371:241-1344(+)|eukprot:CAMPEP_0119483918 /NCGR_PEP_ID=MMETSP1344-20130328/11108_1 /TAXON_ID=236787 /ORGANISM="Florenciella parvula, Strain CCMP2471" /LENGTH=367 /DNA_ID=CAMNT_0007518449 /DNA_START=229 /DNA_END=1332 /DNA_ORIENTATION=+
MTLTGGDTAYDWGLEDKMLRTNIPGRYTQWDKDDDEEEGGKNYRAEWIDPGEGADEAGAAGQPMNESQRMERDVADLQRKIAAGMPETVAKTSYAHQMGAKTGPKGVLNDYKEHKRIEAHNKQVDKLHREAVLNRMAYGATASNTLSLAQERIDAQVAQQEREAEEEADAAEEEDFLSKFREARIRELQSASTQPVFGNIVEVAAHEYCEAIDKCDPRVFVVVHIYEDYVKECGRMNRCFEELARSYTNVKFVRLKSTESPSPFDPVTLPTICVYKAGDLCNSFVRVQDTVGTNFSSDDIEWMLNQEGVFESKQGGIVSSMAPSNLSNNFVGGQNGNEYRARYEAEINALNADFGGFSDEEDSDFEN